MDPVNIDTMLARFAERWSPKKIAQVNDYDVRIVKVQGEFTWHTHAAEARLRPDPGSMGPGRLAR